jgi:protoporphyrinogen oxidase
MNQKAQDIVVAGAGITGLMIALQLTKTHPGSRISVFDRAAEVGGMYASVKYPNGQVFDHGMHVIYESCTPAIDDLYREVMPPQDWHILEQNEKDIAGLFFRGKLQSYSHYVDLRSFPEGQQRDFAASIMRAVATPRPEAIESCGDFLEAQFGPEVVNAVHDQVLDSLYGIPASEASMQAVRLTALERVILFDAPTMLDLMKADKIRSRLGFPDQLNLPPYRANTQKALYPKQFGMGHFVDRLKQLLLSRGVALHTSTSLAQIHRAGERIDGVTLSAEGEADERLPVDALVWTVGWPTLARSLGVSLQGLAPPPSGRTKLAIANLVFDRAPAMDRLYYFYCYDTGFATFRVTNYSNYCPAASADGTFPVGVELWPARLGAGSEKLTDDELVALAVDELRKFGVIDDHRLLFGAIHRGGGEFPVPSLQADRQLREVRERVRAVLPENVIVAGIQAEPGLFFVPDILNDAFTKMAHL